MVVIVIVCESPAWDCTEYDIMNDFFTGSIGMTPCCKPGNACLEFLFSQGYGVVLSEELSTYDNHMSSLPYYGPGILTIV